MYGLNSDINDIEDQIPVETEETMWTIEKTDKGEFWTLNPKFQNEENETQFVEPTLLEYLNV